MIIKKHLLFIFCFLFACFFSQNRKQPVDLKIKGDYTHLATKTIFPMLWSGFQREAVISYDMKNTHVAVSYVQEISKKNKTVLTIYLYPKNLLTIRF